MLRPSDLPLLLVYWAALMLACHSAESLFGVNEHVNEHNSLGFALTIALSLAVARDRRRRK